MTHTPDYFEKVDASSDRILIMGAGNTVMADEGVGPRALEMLSSYYEFPSNVQFMDVGTMGLIILDYLRDIDRLIVLDAAQGTGHEPGTVVLYTKEELAENQVMHSAHDARLMDVFKAASLLGIELKSTVIVGVQVASLEQWVLELTPAVEASLPVACAATLEILSNMGIDAQLKDGVEIPHQIIEARRDFTFSEEG